MIATSVRPIATPAMPPQAPNAAKKVRDPGEGSLSAPQVTTRSNTHSVTETYAHYESGRRLGKTLEAFGSAFDRVTSRMRAIRPDITDASYDLKLDQGKLKVVGDSMDGRSRIWLEESVNGDRELVRLAKEFNELAVEILDPEVCPEGDGFKWGGRRYDKLDATIDRTTRFVSLLKGMGDSNATEWWLSDDPFRAAELIERQVISDTYEYQAKGGSIELMRRMVTRPFYALS